jgi:hypothetical protein
MQTLIDSVSVDFGLELSWFREGIELFGYSHVVNDGAI